MFVTGTGVHAAGYYSASGYHSLAQLYQPARNSQQNNNQVTDKRPNAHRFNHHINSRFLSYRYVSQKGRGNANDGCEAASLLMALQHFGLAKHKTLDQFVNTIPRSKNPERGYTGNPYKFGTGASLYPKALLKVAKRYGAKKSYLIDDYYPHRKGFYHHRANVHKFIRAVLKGYPVVFEGANMMQYGGRTKRKNYRGYRSDHVLMLYGYKKHRFYWTDPDHWYDAHGSTSQGLFMYIINAPVRGPRAVAIGR